MVGNSTWQTMENSDLLVMAKTALHGPDYERFYLQSNGCLTSTGALTNTHAQLGSDEPHLCAKGQSPPLQRIMGLDGSRRWRIA